MKVYERGGWVFYISEDFDYGYERDKVGKWMYYSKDINFMSEICRKAVNDKLVAQAKHSTEKRVAWQAKHSNKSDGVAHFYLNCDDMETHKKILSFFMDNNLIDKPKNGRFNNNNISFKLDAQTKTGQYGKDFRPEIKLCNFIDLDSGEWLT